MICFYIIWLVAVRTQIIYGSFYVTDWESMIDKALGKPMFGMSIYLNTPGMNFSINGLE